MPTPSVTTTTDIPLYDGDDPDEYVSALTDAIESLNLSVRIVQAVAVEDWDVA